MKLETRDQGYATPIPYPVKEAGSDRRVLVSVRLGCFLGVMFCVQMMAVRNMGVLRRFIMSTIAMMFRRGAVVFGSLLVMRRRRLMVLRDLGGLLHGIIPSR